MHQPLHLLRSELANTSIKLKNKHLQPTIKQDYEIQFTFNGFSKTTSYNEHLRQFYDQFKIALEQTLVDSPLLFDRFRILETVRLTILEGEKLTSQIPISEFDFENIFTANMDIRLEADIKKRFGKK